METQKKRDDEHKGSKQAADPEQERKKREQDPNRTGGTPDREDEDKRNREGNRSPNR